jgi:hypothetical protein
VTEPYALQITTRDIHVSSSQLQFDIASKRKRYLLAQLRSQLKMRAVMVLFLSAPECKGIDHMQHNAAVLMCIKQYA